MKNEDIIRSVICILAIDGKVEPQEKLFLEHLCKRFDVSNEIVNDLLKQAEAGKQSIRIPRTPEQQTLLFTLLVQAARSDGIISPQEHKVLQAIADKIGMTAEDVRHIIEASYATSIESDNITEIIENSVPEQKAATGLSSIKMPKFSLKKRIFIGILTIVICSGIGGWYVYQSNSLLTVLDGLIPGGDTTVIVMPPVPNPKPIDKLFTAFVYMPILERKYKDLHDLSGYCFRQYEVGIGYDQVTNLFPQYLSVACKGNADQLPMPQILATNTVDADAKGDYTLSECNALDQGDRESHRKIKGDLIMMKHWEGIVKNSQNMLMTFMKVYCPQN